MKKKKRKKKKKKRKKNKEEKKKKAEFIRLAFPHPTFFLDFLCKGQTKKKP